MLGQPWEQPDRPFSPAPASRTPSIQPASLGPAGTHWQAGTGARLAPMPDWHQLLGAPLRRSSCRLQRRKRGGEPPGPLSALLAAHTCGDTSVGGQERVGAQSVCGCGRGAGRRRRTASHQPTSKTTEAAHQLCSSPSQLTITPQCNNRNATTKVRASPNVLQPIRQRECQLQPWRGTRLLPCQNQGGRAGALVE